MPTTGPIAPKEVASASLEVIVAARQAQTVAQEVAAEARPVPSEALFVPMEPQKNTSYAQESVARGAKRAMGGT